MLTNKLTAQQVRDMPIAEQGQKFVWDAGQPGLGVRVGTKGKAYIVQNRVKGRTRRVTIGKTDQLTLNEARKLAKKALAEMADGKDRNAELRIERAKLMTLGEAVTGWLDERTHRPSTATSYRNTMRREFSDWYSKELRSITPKVFQARYMDMLNRTPAGAALAVRTFRSCWNWARADVTDKDGNAILPECPADIVKAKKLMPKPTRKQSYVSDWAAFFDALDSVETRSNRHKDAGESFRIFVELLARTGLRQGEAANLRWADVDMEARTFTIVAERAKNGEALTLPMADQTFTLFEALKERTGAQAFIWGAAPIRDPRKTLATFREYLGWPLGFHDLRRSFAVAATALDVQQSKLKRLLNHSSASDVTSGYQVLRDPEMLRGATQQISDFIDEKRKLKSLSEAS